ncbi:solute carrier family 23 member 2 [Neocloeon triangulifer]|uniref:solute carrier family 23 member 2 n=1 Tax=Neocloeon triangulifer TaxID=2078957 RepID=UPI00286F4A53|nr:solute carrier family 23 member 2 [Neocloeon triangulifer]
MEVELEAQVKKLLSNESKQNGDVQIISNNNNNSKLSMKIEVDEENFKNNVKSKLDISEDELEPGEKTLHYGLEDNPPWYTCIILGFQHYVTFVVGIVSVPVVMCPKLCMLEDDAARGELVSTLIFVSGLVTIMQTTIGVRLPIVQGSSFGFLAPALALLNLPKWQCPPQEQILQMSLEDRRALWQVRVNEVSGAILIASLFQMAIGYLGLIGLVLKYITPLTIAPTVALIGLCLFDAAAREASGNWWIAAGTIALLTLFSLYMRFLEVPLPQWGKKKIGENKKRKTFPFFQIFPVLTAMVIMWIVCGLLTATGILPEENLARTDSKLKILQEAPWFHFPYPGQWGSPTISAAAVFGMLAGVIAGAIESVGDYYACAQFCEAPPPPIHAVNRGIGTEGLGCLIAGIWGTGNGTTSFSQNIGAIGVTKVGSRRVVQYAGVIMLTLGAFSKVGAFFVTIPSPIIGGVFCITFGMVTAVGISTLHFVSLKSFRNMYIIGFSIFFALVLPRWMEKNPDVIKTGSEFIDQLCTVLLSTSMFVGGLIGFVLDNTVPGTDEERGLTKWNKHHDAEGLVEKDTPTCYDLPFGMDYIRKAKWTSYLPFMPTFRKH